MNVAGVALPLPLAGEAGGGWLPRVALPEWREPPPAALFEHHSRSKASAFPGTAAEGGLCSPQAGEVKRFRGQVGRHEKKPRDVNRGASLREELKSADTLPGLAAAEHAAECTAL